MALKTPAQGVPSPIIMCDTFADIPFDPATGNFLPVSASGSFLAGQMFGCLDDGNQYQVLPNGSGALVLVAINNNMVVQTTAATLVRGILVAKVTVGGKWNVAGAPTADLPNQGVTARACTINLQVPVITGGTCLVLVANNRTISPGEVFSNDGSGLATDLAVTKPSGYSIDTADRVGNGTSVFVLARLTTAGN